MLNKSDFINAMSGLCELYNKIPSEFILDVYYKIFQDYDISQFNRAVTECIKSNKYNVLPKPAEILEFLEGDKDDKALVAWVMAKNGVQQFSYYGSPKFDDPIISHCIQELGGWMEFCSVSLSELPFVEKRFMDYYRLFLRRGVNQSKQLTGFIELKNNQAGYDLPNSGDIKEITNNVQTPSTCATHAQEDIT